MRVELTPDAAQWVQTEMEAGRFETPEDAIRHAVRQTKLRELRALIDASIERGGSYTAEEVRRSVQESLKELDLALAEHEPEARFP